MTSVESRGYWGTARPLIIVCCQIQWKVIRHSGGFDNGIAIEFTCEARIEVSFHVVSEISSICLEREHRGICGKSHL